MGIFQEMKKNGRYIENRRVKDINNHLSDFSITERFRAVIMNLFKLRWQGLIVELQIQYDTQRLFVAKFLIIIIILLKVFRLKILLIIIKIVLLSI